MTDDAPKSSSAPPMAPLLVAGIVVLFLCLAGVVVFALIFGEELPSTQGPGLSNAKPVVAWELPATTFTDQDGQPGSLEDYAGEVYLFKFFFTACENPCPHMTRAFRIVQDETAAMGLGELKLLSFSVTPRTDTPEVLRSYGERFGADFSRWRFARPAGMKEDTLYPLISATKDGDPVHHAEHSPRAFLVDRSGRIRRFYLIQEPSERAILYEDLRLIFSGREFQ